MYYKKNTQIKHMWIFCCFVLKQTLAQTPFHNKLCRNNNKLCCYKSNTKKITFITNRKNMFSRAHLAHIYPFFLVCLKTVLKHLKT